jgi:hypothetical protein
MPANFSAALLHRSANSIKLFVSQAVRALATMFSTNFSTQLLKSFYESHEQFLDIGVLGVRLSPRNLPRRFLTYG